MSDEDDSGEEVGSVEVRITNGQVQRAVRNILANEMKLDPVAIREEVRAAAHELIRKEVIEHIEKSGYGHAGLKDWAQRTMDHHKKELDAVLKQVVRELVREKLNEEIIAVVGAVIKDGITVSLGWNRKINVKMEEKKSE